MGNDLYFSAGVTFAGACANKGPCRVDPCLRSAGSDIFQQEEFMFSKSLSLILGAMAFVFFGMASATASETWQKYTPETFAAAQAEGKTMIVDVYASWCPTCRKQAPILEKLSTESDFSDVTFVRVSFDDDKDFLKAHQIPRQSTILVFKDGEETARSVAETNADKLKAALLSGL